MRPRRAVRDRFERYFVPEPNSGCWLWTNYVDKDGYGSMKTDGTARLRRAHRVSWELHRGPIPAGAVVRHKCDVSCCVNPDHLELGTQAENIRDRDVRGRTAVGERHGKSKLTEDAVRTIRNGVEPTRVYAAQFRIHRNHIDKIRAGAAWERVV